DVGVVGVWAALKLPELRIGAGDHLDLWVTREADDTGAVGAPARRKNRLHQSRLLVCGTLRAGLQVGRDDQRLLGRRRLQLEARERAREEQDDDQAQAER